MGQIKSQTGIITSPVYLSGCETWILALMEEHRSRVFENGVPRRIFGPKREEVAGDGDYYIMRSS
jgi:hypothetical protein